MGPDTERTPADAYYDREEIWSPEGSYGRETEGARADLIVELVAERAPASVLDVGAGSGIVANRLHQKGLDVLAYDRSDIALRQVAGRTAVGDVAEMPFADRSFEAAVASELFEHLPHDTFERARHELARVTRDFAVVTVPNEEDLLASAVVCPVCGCRSSPHRHLRSFEPKDFEALLPGFHPERVFPFGPADLRRRRVEMLVRRDLLGGLGWPESALCPQCG